jgi:hypothetical protein
MTIRGHVRNGRVVLDEPATLPEGAEVEVSSLDPADEADDFLVASTSRTFAADRKPSAELERRFRQLVDDWKQATLLISSGTELLLHRAYQQIIGLGRRAVPLLLAELRREPDHWFWALTAITGENPVADADRGNLARMADAWRNWAQQRGY